MSVARHLLTVAGMDRSSALGHLPAHQAVAMRLRDSGRGDQVIAAVVGVGVEELSTVLQDAERNLAILMTLELVKPARTVHFGRPPAQRVTAGARESGS